MGNYNLVSTIKENEINPFTEYKFIIRYGPFGEEDFYAFLDNRALLRIQLSEIKYSLNSTVIFKISDSENHWVNYLTLKIDNFNNVLEDVSKLDSKYHNDEFDLSSEMDIESKDIQDLDYRYMVSYKSNCTATLRDETDNIYGQFHQEFLGICWANQLESLKSKKELHKIESKALKCKYSCRWMENDVDLTYDMNLSNDNKYIREINSSYFRFTCDEELMTVENKCSRESLMYPCVAIIYSFILGWYFSPEQPNRMMIEKAKKVVASF